MDSLESLLDQNDSMIEEIKGKLKGEFLQKVQK